MAREGTFALLRERQPSDSSSLSSTPHRSPHMFGKLLELHLGAEKGQLDGEEGSMLQLKVQLLLSHFPQY